MSTSQFALDYAEYDALLVTRFDMALAVVGQVLPLRLSEKAAPAPPEVRTPRPPLANHQQPQDALLADAHQVFAAQPEGGEQPGHAGAAPGWRAR